MCGAATIIPSVLGPEVRVVALVRVHPHHPVAEPGQPLHGRGQDLRIAAVKAIGADDHDPAPAQPAAAPVPDERVQRGTDPGPALPVKHRPSGQLQRVVRAAVIEGPGDPGQPGAEAEHLDLGRPRVSPSRRTAAGCASSRPSSRTRPGSGSAAGAGPCAAARTARPARRACAATPAPCGAGRASVPTGAAWSAGCAASAASAGSWP